MDLLVVHGISLPPGEFGGDFVERLFCGALDCEAHPYFAALKNLRVSSHFFIRRNGEITQFVPCHMRAWHAGKSQWRGRSGCNDFSVGAELEGEDHSPYEAAQYDSLAFLAMALAARRPGIAAAGHEHVAPGRKTDPGPAFDWSRLFAMIGEEHDGRA